MGVSYAPFGVDDESLIIAPQKRSVPVVRREPVGLLSPFFDHNSGLDSTECNYLIIFFIFGIFLLVVLQ